MTSDDFSERIKKLYKKQLQENGAFSSHTIAWNSGESQRIRFEVLAQIANLENQIVLDVGSGLGDLADFLRHFNVFYQGIEISPELTKESEKKYPTIRIINDNFLDHEFNAQYDYVLSSGAFNIRNPDHEEYLQKAIKKMYELSRKGTAFNLPSLLSEFASDEQYFDEELDIKIAYIDPTEIFKFCKSLCNRVTLRHDYLPHDFTIYMFK